MTDLPTIDSPTNASEYTVSEISGALKRTVEDTFGNVRVRGEISGYRGPHTSGHAYFALKDERARLEAVIWKTTFQRLRFRPEEGMEIIAAGRLTTYPGSSKYQIVIDSLEPAGAGALMALLEERKRRLEAEGLFAPERKRPLPFMPRVIGVVTSPTGAVIRDITHRITDRFPLHVLVWPVRVQGETTGQEVSAAINGFNMLDGGAIPRPDVLIVARGGGSLEDLWGFNDEAVVRAVADSRIPVISAVGHETDWTLIDLAADRRAPTPTGAAELAVPVRADLEAGLASLSARLKGCTSRHLDRRGQALRAAARALPSPDQLLALPRRRFDECALRLGRALEVGTQQKQARLGALRLMPSSLSRRTAACRREVEQTGLRLQPLLRHLVSHRRSRFDRIAIRVTETALRRRIADGAVALAHAARRADQCIQARAETRRLRLAQSWRLAETLSYQSVLQRGFALVRDADRQPVKTAAALRPGAQISIEFADGQVDALTAGRTRKTGGRTNPAETQESLF